MGAAEANRGRLRASLPAALALASALGCRGAAPALGPSPDEARAHAADLLGALASRFGPHERDARFESLRPKLARAAFAPSRIFEDASAWTGGEGETRMVELAGAPGSGRYRIRVEAGAPAPARPADYRGVVGLTSLGDGAFEWTVRDELAVGGVAAEDLSRALTAIFLAAEESAGADAPARLRQELPRSAAALGRLFSLETLRLARGPEGGVLVNAGAVIRPEGIRAGFPRFARYLEKYVNPVRFSALARDAPGAWWGEAHLRDGRASLRLRLHGGDLAPLQDRPRRIPEALQLRVGLSTKLGIFRVGVRGLEADVRLVRARPEKALTARFGKDPDWQLPFLIQPFLRASLRRPFEGGGAALSFAIRDGGEAGPTLVTRDCRIAVKESWVLRWLGGLMGDAVTEFRQGAEEETDRFVGEALAALRDDVVGSIPPR